MICSWPDTLYTVKVGFKPKCCLGKPAPLTPHTEQLSKETPGKKTAGYANVDRHLFSEGRTPEWLNPFMHSLQEESLTSSVTFNSSGGRNVSA